MLDDNNGCWIRLSKRLYPECIFQPITKRVKFLQYFSTRKIVAWVLRHRIDSSRGRYLVWFVVSWWLVRWHVMHCFIPSVILKLHIIYIKNLWFTISSFNITPQKYLKNIFWAKDTYEVDPREVNRRLSGDRIIENSLASRYNPIIL